MVLDLFLRLSPLQAVTHPCAELAWCCWTSSSAVPFSAVTHPTADRARCCLTFSFDCLFFRRSPIQVPSWPVQLDFIFGCPVSGGHPFHCRSSSVLLDLFLRMSCCLTFFFDCLLFRRSSIQVPTRHGAVGLHLRLSRLPAITHPTADRARCGLAFFFECLRDALPFSSIVSSSGRHPSMCRSGLVLLEFIFSCRVSSGHPSHC